MKLVHFFLVMAFFCAAACNQRSVNNHSKQSSIALADSVYIPRFANRFKIQYFNNHKVIEVLHPWDSTAAPLKTILSSDTLFLKEHPEAIRIPVKKWISVASTQVCYAKELNVINSIVGIAEPEYISNAQIINGIKEGAIRNIGTAYAPDVEVVLSLNPAMMMVSPFKDDFYGSIRSAGVNVVSNSSYLENEPLGRMEWLVYVASFFNKEQEAVKKVNEIANRYQGVKEAAMNADKKPQVFSGKTFQGIWYAPAAESYKANFLRDAAVQYIFDDRHGTGSLNYDFETVYEAAGSCEYWIMLVNYVGEFSYSALKDEDARYVDFDAFKNKKVIYSNTSNSKYYEEGVMRPDVILSDMVKLFHPNLLQDYVPVYYRKLTKE